MHDRGSAGFHALFRKAGLPESTYPAFREAIGAMREGGFDPGGTTRLKRRMVERVLTRADADGTTPARAADRLAEDRLAAAQPS